jgi:hypothetical protein
MDAAQIASLIAKLGLFLAQRRKTKKLDREYRENMDKIKARGPEFFDEGYRSMWDRTGDEVSDKDELIRRMGY